MGKSAMLLRLLPNHRDFLAVHKIKMLIIFLAVRLYVFCEYDKIYTNIISERGENTEHIKKMRARDPELSTNWGTICTPVQMPAADGKSAASFYPYP